MKVNDINLPIHLLHGFDKLKPTTAYSGDAGLDLYAAAGAEFRVGDQHAIPLGVCVAIPRGYVGFMCSRSGLARKHGIQVTNAPGIIDSGYRGELFAILSRVAYGSDKHTIVTLAPNTAVCQLLILPVMSPLVINTSAAAWQVHHADTERGDRGFGSSG